MFHLFSFYSYYPEGGMCDYCGSFESERLAEDHAIEKGRDYYQIVTDFSKEVRTRSVSELERDRERERLEAEKAEIKRRLDEMGED